MSTASRPIRQNSRTSPTTVAALCGAAVALTALAAPAAHAQLRAYAGAVAGNATIGPAFQCATSGPSIGAPWFAGVAKPVEGIAACGLSGLENDQVGALGPLTAVASASGPMAGGLGTFTGTSAARAGYWNLGASAAGAASGGTSAFTYGQAAAFASFAEDVTYSSPSVPAGTVGTTNYAFLVEGAMRNLPVGSYTQQGDVALAIYVNHVLWSAFLGTTVNDHTPYVRGGSTGLPGNFVLSPGAFAGSATVTTNGNFDMVWGTPLHVEVALYTTVTPCCYGASIASDFANTAVLTGVDAYASGTLVRDFVATTSSGLRLNANGVIPSATVPEPAPAALVCAAFATVFGCCAAGTGRRPARLEQGGSLPPGN